MHESVSFRFVESVSFVSICRSHFAMFRLAICSVAVANAANLAPALRLRGGLGDLDGGAVAKAFVSLAGVDAGLSTISGAK